MGGSVKYKKSTDGPEYSVKKQILANEAMRDHARAEDIGFICPKIDTTGNNSVIGRHPDKAAAIIMNDDKKYPKSQINLVAGICGPAASEIHPVTKEPVVYNQPNKLDAASVVISEGTDDTGLVSLKGKPNFRSAVKMKADTVKVHGTVVEISAGGQKYLACGAKNMPPAGAVHIVAGNTTHGGSYSLQPMVKGDNLLKCVEELTTFMNKQVEVQRAIIQEIIDLKLALVSHFHIAPPPIGATGVSVDLCASIGFSAVDSAKAVANNAGVTVNNEIFKMNWLKPSSPKYILSRFNKVN